MDRRIKRKFRLSWIPFYLRKWLGMKRKGKWFICMCEDMIKETKEDWLKHGSTELVGFYSSFKEAERILNNNIYDIRECLYDYAIIEYVCEGTYGTAQMDHVDNIFAYKWNEEKQGFFRAEEEDWKLKGIIGYGF